MAAVLDPSAYISTVTNRAFDQWGKSNDQYQWAKDQFAKNSGTTDTVVNRALDTGANFGGYAATDRGDYDTMTRPAMKQQMDFATDYASPSRMAVNRASAIAGSNIASDAQLRKAEADLGSYGVDPTSGRWAALKAGMATRAGATAAAAGTQSDRATEMLGQQYLGNAIKTGQVLPGQVGNEANVGMAAGNQAVNAGLATTASGSATMGTPIQWAGLGNDMIKQWEGAQKDSAEVALGQEKIDQGASSGTGAAIGAGAGLLGGVAKLYSAFGGGSSTGMPGGGSTGGSGTIYNAGPQGSGPGGTYQVGDFPSVARGGSIPRLRQRFRRGGRVQRFAGGGPVETNHLQEADAEMGLSPQEKALYERHWMNLSGQGGVDNPDGSRSTIRNMTFERDGKTHNVPTVYDGRVVSDDDAVRLADEQGMDSFPSSPSRDYIDQRYNRMHDFMERDTQDRQRRMRGFDDGGSVDGGGDNVMPAYDGGGDVLHGILGTVGELAGNLIPIPVVGPTVGHFLGHAAADTIEGKTDNLDDDAARDFTAPLPFGIGGDLTRSVGIEQGNGPGDQLEGGVGGLMPFASQGMSMLAQGGDVTPGVTGDDEMAEGEGGQQGNMVPTSASPSGGANTDDVHAMVSADEFVMPKDVAKWYGEKYLQGMIEKARKEMLGATAKPEPTQVPQAMAMSPPSYRSEGARA